MVIKQTQIAKVIYLTVVSNNKYTTFDTDFKNAFNYTNLETIIDPNLQYMLFDELRYKNEICLQLLYSSVSQGYLYSQLKLGPLFKNLKIFK